MVFSVAFIVLIMFSVEIKGGGNGDNLRPQDALHMILLDLTSFTEITHDALRNINLIMPFFHLLPSADRHEILMHHQSIKNIYRRVVPQGGLLTPDQLIENQNDFRLSLTRLYISSNRILLYLRAQAQQALASPLQAHQVQAHHAQAQYPQVNLVQRPQAQNAQLNQRQQINNAQNNAQAQYPQTHFLQQAQTQNAQLSQQEQVNRGVKRRQDNQGGRYRGY